MLQDTCSTGQVAPLQRPQLMIIVLSRARILQILSVGGDMPLFDVATTRDDLATRTKAFLVNHNSVYATSSLYKGSVGARLNVRAASPPAPSFNESREGTRLRNGPYRDATT